MNYGPSTDSHPYSTARDFVLTFWPVVFTPIVWIASVRFGYPWIGMVVLLGVLFARRWWWTCIFGLLNMNVIMVGLIGCIIASVRMLMK